jgi:hypothetical protein
MPQVLEPMSAADLRAILGRTRVPAYLVAARIPMHPCRFSRLVNDDAEPIPSAISRRVLEAIEAIAAERRRA